VDCGLWIVGLWDCAIVAVSRLTAGVVGVEEKVGLVKWQVRKRAGKEQEKRPEYPR
jgi:hypothetical protein